MKSVRPRGRRRPRVQIGKPDASLTGVSGLAAVDRLVGKLALAETLDAAGGVVKHRDRGLSGGKLLVALASCQFAGGVHLVSLDRLRSDPAGQALMA